MTDWQNIELQLRVVDVASGGSITYTTPEGIFEELARLGLVSLEDTGRSCRRGSPEIDPYHLTRYVSAWKEAK